jgi:F-type H+-transporting ATPase subunit alpha
MIFYAAVNNYLGDIDLDKIKVFEKGLYDFVDTHYPEISAGIRAAGVLEESAEESLKGAILKYKEVFKKEYDTLL